jgi:RIO kinase 2
MIDHATVFKSLQPVELKILRAIENGMKTHEYVSVEDMAANTGLSEKEIEYRLRNLVGLDLLERFTGHYVGYQLKYNGYDILAISAFLRRDTINSLGGLIGVGKEPHPGPGRR